MFERVVSAPVPAVAVAREVSERAPAHRARRPSVWARLRRVFGGA